MTLKVIGAGVGRTGTYSLKLALEKLGFGPCHHMEEVIKNPSVNIPIWHAAARGKPDWNAAYKGNNSAVDWPTAAFWRELMGVYPQAKVILTARSAENWYRSFSTTIFKLLAGMDQALPHMRPFLEMASAVIAKNGISLEMTPDAIIKTYSDHVDAVKKAVPTGRLLVFEVKEGWGPLCRFLGQPVPDTDFPRSNDQKDFWDRINNVPQ